MPADKPALDGRTRSAGEERPPVLEFDNFSVEYLTSRGPVRAVDRLTLRLHHGEVLGLAGESGSGKSTAALGALRLLPPPAVITGGRVLFEGQDILELSEPALAAFRWRKIAVVFQSAMNSLSPVLSVETQICDVIRHHERVSRSQARERAAELLALVGIDSSRLTSYPHQLSGGMRQRVVIAIALALQPRVLFMDEPTTALDVVVQKEILQQIAELRRQLGFAVLFITHDLSLMLDFCDTIGVLYAGRLAEVAPARALRERPQHPYTRGLLNSFPEITGPRQRLTGIGGAPPHLLDPPSGCRFHPRCADALAECKSHIPQLTELAPLHFADCLRLRSSLAPPLGPPVSVAQHPAAGQAGESDEGESDEERITRPEVSTRLTRERSGNDSTTSPPPRAERAPDPREQETQSPPATNSTDTAATDTPAKDIQGRPAASGGQDRD